MHFPSAGEPSPASRKERLEPGRVLDARRGSRRRRRRRRSAAARRSTAAARLSGAQPARQRPGLAELETLRAARQSKLRPLPPGKRRPARRLGVEQQQVGDVGVLGERGQIGRLLDARGLHHPAAGAEADRRYPLRRLVAVQLEDVERDVAQAGLELGVAGVDEQADGCGPAARPAAASSRARAGSSERGEGG